MMMPPWAGGYAMCAVSTLNGHNLDSV
eukprot:COSAG06_NODE_37202_length_438_cov_0.607670_2_plen_26_part_01